MPRRVEKKNFMAQGRVEVSGKNLTEALAEKMGEAIMEGALGPGELLPPLRQLATHHEVGVVTVRNAIDKLISLNIVEAVPRVGYRVHQTSSKVPGVIKIGVIYRRFHPRSTSMQNSISEIEAEIRKRDWLLMFAISEGNAEIEDSCIRRLRASGMQALLIVPAEDGKRSLELEKWVSEGNPTVLEGHSGRWLLPANLIAKCDMLDVDNAGGVKRILDYLWSLGHRHISFFSTEKVKFNERLKAYRGFVKKKGVADLSEIGISSERVETDQFVGDWVRRNKKSTAVVCTSDNLAFSVIEGAKNFGIEVPLELSVTGFGNDIVEFPVGVLPITTIDYSRRELALESIRMLDGRLGGNAQEAEQVYLKTPLVVRESCSVNSK